MKIEELIKIFDEIGIKYQIEKGVVHIYGQRLYYNVNNDIETN